MKSLAVRDKLQDELERERALLAQESAALRRVSRGAVAYLASLIRN
jgi:hypothetical protein